MTRLAILADIHGNLPALEAVIKDMQQFNPEHVIVAGDLINGVPLSAEVMQRVVELGWTAIRGNHEFYMLDYDTVREREKYKRTIMPAALFEEVQEWYPIIAAMPDTLMLYYRDAPPIRVIHGLPHTNRRAITPLSTDEEICDWLVNIEENTIITAHYHIALERHVNRWHILNPGPVGMSCDGIRKAGYMILDGDLDGWKATFRRVDYDFDAVEAAFNASDVLNRLGVLGHLRVQQLRTARPIINSFVHWFSESKPNQEQPRVDDVGQFLTSGLLWDYLGEGYQVNPHLMPFYENYP